MAGIEKIKEKILLEAEQKAKSNVAEANKNAEAILKRAEVTTNLKVQEIAKKTEQSISEKKRIIISMNDLELKKELLNTKQELIGMAFDKALEKLSSLQFDNAQDFIKKMIVQNSETGAEELLLSDQLKPICDSNFMEDVNQRLLKVGKKGAVRISNNCSDIKSGFVLKNGGIELNCSFEAILKTYRDELESTVVGLLF